MVSFAPIRALLFDLDGTLIDSEVQTEAAITEVVARHGVAGFSLPVTETHGRTWTHIARTICERTGLVLPIDPLVDELQAAWDDSTTAARPVPGGADTMRRAASQGIGLAVVSSSPHAVIDTFMQRLGVDAVVRNELRVGGDEVRRGKPEPEGFLLAASRLGLTPAECLVCEDSHAGLRAAQSAGMRSLYITCCAGEQPDLVALATALCHDYTRLPESFWSEILTGRAPLAGGAWR